MPNLNFAEAFFKFKDEMDSVRLYGSAWVCIKGLQEVAHSLFVSFGRLWITQALRVSHKNDIELTSGQWFVGSFGPVF
jgi:hypothetical protein